MKPLYRRLLLTALLATTARAEIEFVGVLVTSEHTLFTLHETSPAASGWRELGQTFAGYTLTDYDAKDDTLTLTKDGVKTRVHLKDAKVQAARFELAGTFTLGVGEKMEVVRATMAFGEETAFPLKDGTVFRITPQSRSDRNILYRASFDRPRPDGTIEKIAAPSVVAIPGTPFSISVGELGFAFTPRP